MVNGRQLEIWNLLQLDNSIQTEQLFMKETLNSDRK